MRIRKRFPSSSLFSLAFSDPQLNRPSVVQERHQEGIKQVHPHGNSCLQESRTTSSLSDAQNQPHPLPSSDQEIMIGNENAIWALATAAHHQQQQEMIQKELDGEKLKDEGCKKKEEQGKSSNDIRKLGSFSDAEIYNGDLNSGSTSQQGVEKWYEDDKVIPLKKRRGSFERENNENKTNVKMKTKTNKKCAGQKCDVDQLEAGKEGSNIHKNNNTGSGSSTATTSGNNKKNKRGNVIMEGSRCSRVNGRGWRCCQQTLVGYSLCEHHLGKGRLSSMTSVRNRSTATAVAPLIPKKLNNNDHEYESELHRDHHLSVNLPLMPVQAKIDDDETKPLVGRKKRMNLGMVKARSISSLLGQPGGCSVTEYGT